MIRSWVYYLMPLWWIEWVLRRMNPHRIDEWFSGVPAWKRKDGSEIWVCLKRHKTLVDNIRAHTQQVHKCPKCGAWVNCHTDD